MIGGTWEKLYGGKTVYLGEHVGAGAAPTKSPDMEEYNLTYEQYLCIQQHCRQVEDNLSWVILPTLITIAWAYFVFDSDTFTEVGTALSALGAIFGMFMITAAFCGYLTRYVHPYLLKRIPGYSDYCNYENALSMHRAAVDKLVKEQKIISARQEQEWKRRQHDYWTSLDPYEFEREIAALFEKRGYTAIATKGSDDGGIDVLLQKDGVKGIVQCKRYKDKVGPGPIRDLYGAMKAGDFQFAFIVCPSGFSDKANEFSKGKNITLVGLKGIMEMVE